VLVAYKKKGMEVGIEDSLHIEFEYKKSKLHLSDVVLGKVYFLQVRIDRHCLYIYIYIYIYLRGV